MSWLAGFRDKISCFLCEHLCATSDALDSTESTRRILGIKGTLTINIDLRMRWDLRRAFSAYKHCISSALCCPRDYWQVSWHYNISIVPKMRIMYRAVRAAAVGRRSPLFFLMIMWSKLLSKGRQKSFVVDLVIFIATQWRKVTTWLSHISQPSYNYQSAADRLEQATHKPLFRAAESRFRKPLFPPSLRLTNLNWQSRIPLPSGENGGWAWF